MATREPVAVGLRQRAGGALLGLISLFGLGAFLGPVFLAATPGAGHGAGAPLVFALLTTALLGLLLAESSGGQLNARAAATLGVLTAINALLRLVPGPADSPTFFFLVILCGYVFGARFGFLLGALSLFVSALITAGVGPWLPFQMLGLGWTGLAAAGLPAMRRGLRIQPGGWGELALLVGFGWLAGFAFGLLMSLTAWPLLSGAESALGWAPGLGPLEALRRYWGFYLLTSLGWDATRALSNAICIAALGAPILRTLRRFHARFWWEQA